MWYVWKMHLSLPGLHCLVFVLVWCADFCSALQWYRVIEIAFVTSEHHCTWWIFQHLPQEEYWCTLCNKMLGSMGSYESHISGKKHKNKVVAFDALLCLWLWGVIRNTTNLYPFHLRNTLVGDNKEHLLVGLWWSMVRNRECSSAKRYGGETITNAKIIGWVGVQSRHMWFGKWKRIWTRGQTEEPFLCHSNDVNMHLLDCSMHTRNGKGKRGKRLN